MGVSVQTEARSTSLRQPRSSEGGAHSHPAIIERPTGSASEPPSRESARLGGLLNPSVQFCGQSGVAGLLISALLLTVDWPQVLLAARANPLVQAANSQPDSQPSTHNSPPMPATDAQMNAMLLAQNAASRDSNPLDPAHVPFADFHSTRAHPAESKTTPPPPPSPQTAALPPYVYETSTLDANETGGPPDALDLDSDSVDFENPLTRTILSKYLFTTFQNRNISHANSGAESLAANGSAAPPGELSIDRNLLGLDLEPSPQLISEPAGGAKPLVAGEGLAGNASIISLPSNPAQAGSVESSLNAFYLDTDPPFWGDFFRAVNVAYLPFHSVICLVICIIGIFTNVTNIIVLTRPNMITAVNTILCAIACSDLIVNLSNIPYLSHLLSDNSDPAAFFTYGWALYTLMHAHVSVTAHTISIWLTCVLATWRYFVIRSQSISQRNWSERLALRVILGVIVCVPILCIPSYLSFAILADPPARNMVYGTTYRVGFSQLAEQSKVIRTFHFWIFSALTKLLPCVMLSFFTIVLVNKLLQARDRRLRLAQASGNGTSNNLGGQVAPNSQGGCCNHAIDGQQGRLSVPNGRQPSSPAHERQSSVKLRPHVHMIDERTDSSEPILANGIAPERGARAGDERPAGNLQQLARKESLRNVLLVNRRRDSQETTTCRPANCSFDDDDQSQRPHAAACLHSGSSCVTDAECLQASSCNGSSSGSISISLEPLQRETGAAADSRAAQVFGHLLVESALSATSNGSGGTVQHRTTLVAAPSAGSGASSPLHELELARTREMRRPLKPLAAAPAEDPQTPRSASTCGALDLYAQLDARGGNETSHRLAALTPGPASARLRPAEARANLAVSAQEFKVQENDGSLLARNSVSHSNLRPGEPGPQGPEGRVRSIGSATFTPFQIVKLQATQRQLSQNETTTRLLIGVMIIFLICEFPAGILSALCALYGQPFFDNVYQPMGPFTDLFALFNSSINFLVYCFMSTQFRVTFYRVVLRCPAPSAPMSSKK